MRKARNFKGCEKNPKIPTSNPLRVVSELKFLIPMETNQQSFCSSFVWRKRAKKEGCAWLPPFNELRTLSLRGSFFVVIYMLLELIEW